MTYQHRIKPDYKRVPLGPRLQPRVAPPSEWGTLLLVFVCVAAVVVLVAARVLG